MEIKPENIEEIFRALDLQIGARGGKPIGLVVCGGTALAVLGLVIRTTKDVDVLGIALESKGRIQIKKIEKFPSWFEEAAKAVQRDFELMAGWINLGPGGLLDFGLPEGFEKRLEKRSYGKYLSVYYVSRLDQIHFKLYAAIDRDSYHVQDLVELKPTAEEILQAAKWVLTQDVSEEFRILLKEFLRSMGFENVSKKI